MYNKTMLFST